MVNFVAWLRNMTDKKIKSIAYDCYMCGKYDGTKKDFEELFSKLMED